MKINVIGIITDHFKTLSNAKNNKISWVDVFIFFLIPICASYFSSRFDIPVDRDVYSVAITFFGIFAGLLLNVQVAMFSIFQRQWNLPSDPKELKAFNGRSQERRELLSEINTNISYLILFSCLSLCTFFCLFLLASNSTSAVAIFVGILVHFILTLMMTIKRSYILFSKEYKS